MKKIVQATTRIQSAQEVPHEHLSHVPKRVPPVPHLQPAPRGFVCCVERYQAVVT